MLEAVDLHLRQTGCDINVQDVQGKTALHHLIQGMYGVAQHKFCILKALFINKRFALNEMFQRNASKFAIYYVKENPCSFFRFSLRATLYFYLMNALVYVDIDQGIHEVKM